MYFSSRLLNACTKPLARPQPFGLLWLVGLVRLVRPVGLVRLVGLVRPVGPGNGYPSDSGHQLSGSIEPAPVCSAKHLPLVCRLGVFAGFRGLGIYVLRQSLGSLSYFCILRWQSGILKKPFLRYTGVESTMYLGERKWKREGLAWRNTALCQ